MRLFLYVFLICQLLNFLDVFAQKVKEDQTQSNSVKWEKLEEETKPIKKIIWRSYNNDESYFQDEILENKMKPATWSNRTLRFTYEEIDMPDSGEYMGLYSIGAYDRLNPWLYGGITLYGAASGRRGGFFTGGYTLGVDRQLIDNWIFDSGVYLGAGGRWFCGARGRINDTPSCRTKVRHGLERTGPKLFIHRLP